MLFRSSIINHAQKFIELYPDNPVWYAYIGFSSGRIAIALNGPSAVPYQKQIEESAKKAISLKPDYYLPYLNLGVYYRRAATLNPVMKFVVNTFLGGSISNASLKDSLEMLNKSKLLAAKKPLIWYELGITYKMMNKNSEALAAFEEVIRLPISAWGDSKIKAIATQQIKKIHMESRN